MQTLAQYALLGSLLAGAAGALVIATLTLQHGFKRAVSAGADESPEDTARRQRIIRLADTVAVLCFAVSAGLGVVGVMQHTRAVTPAIAAGEETRVAERLEALEHRFAAAPTPDWRAFDERIARIESRLGSVEDRAAVAERRAIASEQLARERRDARPRTAPVATAPSTPRYIAPQARSAPSASPRLSSPTEALVVPESTPPAQPDVAPRPVASATSAAVMSREPARPRAEPPAPSSFSEKVRRDWTTVKDAARRGGEEWREGWDRMKGLFGY